MTPRLLQVFDDVLPDPVAYRAWALSQSFQTIVTGDETWRGIVLLETQDLVSRLVRDRCPTATQPRLSFLRKSPAGQDEPNFIHSDEGMGEWTAILYLNPTPAEGDGTVFWRYRPTGEVYGSARDLDKDPALWEPWQTVEAKFNRLVLFDSWHFHSRAIRENYGEGDDARLVHVVFGAFAAANGIRAARPDDLPALLAMGQRFRSATVYANRIAEHPEHMLALGERLIASPDGQIFVVEHEGCIVGMLGLMLYNHPLTGARTAGELFFWVEPEHRGRGVRLLRHAEQWAREQGATAMQMIAPTPAVEQLYQRLGYAAWEVSYVKELI